MLQVDLLGVGDNFFKELGVDGEVPKDQVELGGGSADGDVEVGVVVESFQQFVILLLIYADHLNIMLKALHPPSLSLYSLSLPHHNEIQFFFLQYTNTISAFTTPMRSLIMRTPTAAFSVINKIRAREKLKQPPTERTFTLPHQIKDHISPVISHQDKHMDLTPHQLYLIETKSMERPFTGNLWGEESPGFYHCAVCHTRLFTFDQKIKTDSGFASFYDYVEKRVNVIDEKVNIELVNLFVDSLIEDKVSRHKRCECAQCKAHIGAVFFDGPHPSFLRYSINSSALNFVKLEDFQDPNIQKRKNKEELERNRPRYLR